MSYGPTHRARRQLEAAAIGTYNIYELTKKGKDVDALDYLEAAGKTAAQIGAILAIDKAMMFLVSKGVIQPITWTLLGLQAIYFGGAAVSKLIDPEEGLQNYNQFIDLAVSSPSITRDLTIQSGLSVIDKKYPAVIPVLSAIENQLTYGIS